MASPSSRRRQGREAYENGYLHSDCPYKDPSDVDDWLEGWNQGYDEATAEVERQSEEEDKWIVDSFGCPWQEYSLCRVNNQICEMRNCAPYYWAKEVESGSE